MIVQPHIDELSQKLNCKSRPALANHFVFINARVPDLDTLVRGAAC